MNFLKNFFRADLNLNHKWWHRLFKMLFAVFSILLLFFIANDGLQQDTYAKVDSLTNRLDLDLKPLRQIISFNERLGRDQSSVVSKSYSGWGGYILSKEHVYCSKEISNHIETVSKITNVYYFKGDKDLISISKFKEYLHEQGALCITVTDFGGYTLDYYKVPNALSWEWYLTEDQYIWTETTFPGTRTIFLYLVEYMALLSLIIIIYYKIFLYILYGKNKLT